MYTIRNDFHNTEYQTRGGKLSSRTVRRIRQHLCDDIQCCCSDILGNAGPQDDGIVITLGYDTNNQRIAFVNKADRP